MQHSETTVSPAAEVEKGIPSKLARNLVFSGLALFLLWFGIKGWRIGQSVQSIMRYQAEAEQMMAAGVANLDPDEVESMVVGMRADVLRIQQELAFAIPLTPYLGWFPKYGPLIEAAPHYLEMADAGTETAVFAFRGLKPALTVFQQDDAETDRIAALIQVVHQAEPNLYHAGQSLDRVIAARAKIRNESDQPQRVQTLLALTDKWLPRAQDGLQVALILPEMMGIDGPRSYLIMAQNEDELRATGGFVTGAGMLVVDNGRIQSLTFQDSYLVDDIWARGYELPPNGYYDIMGFDLFLYRDSNYWPDFPTSAEAAMNLYSYGQELPPLDGTIAIDQRFLELLLRGMGPITIPETNQTIDTHNVVQALQDSWARGEDEEDIRAWLEQRKAFLPVFATAILQRLQSDFGEIDPFILAESLFEAVESKRLQIYMRDPAVAGVMDDVDWDGRLQNPTGQDFWMLVDTNLGFNKVNLYITREMTYQISLDEADNGVATLSATYTHSGERTHETCMQKPPTYEDPSYLAIADFCFWNFLRLYTPDGSTLLEATRYTIPAKAVYRAEGWDQPAYSINELAGWSTFANFFFVEQNSTHQTAFTYTLPPTIVQTVADSSKLYQLYIGKQAGTLTYPVHIIITMPEKSKLISMSPQTGNIEGNQVSFELDLRADTAVFVQYEE
jgi:hypothetical protein